MPDYKDVKRSVLVTDKWLNRKQSEHIKMVEKSLKKLEENIIDTLAKIATNKTGRIEGLSVNLRQAQKVHSQIERLFAGQFSDDMKAIIKDFDSVQQIIKQSFSFVDESAKFTSVDKKLMATLKDGYYQQYLSLGDTQKNKIVQTIYDQVLANGKFSELVAEVSNAVVGRVGVKGTPLQVYAKTYANDFIMNFHNEVQLAKAETAGLTRFLYVGNIIRDSRQFCMSRAGKSYTKSEINGWTHKWQGKSGPALTHRGGYNCRHHWQPIRKEWMEGAKQIDVQNWFTE